MIWKCKEGCSDCCGMIPMDADWAKKHEGKAFVQPVEVLAVPGKNNVLIAVTEDGLCVFLDRDNHKCVVYDDRPEVCRDYGVIPDLPCPFIKPNGRPRSPAMVKRMRRRINRDIDVMMDRCLNDC